MLPTNVTDFSEISLELRFSELVCWWEFDLSIKATRGLQKKKMFWDLPGVHSESWFSSCWGEEALWPSQDFRVDGRDMQSGPRKTSYKSRLQVSALFPSLLSKQRRGREKKIHGTMHKMGLD